MPCACCREKFRAELENNYRSFVDRRGFSFVYAENSPVFHRISCVHARRIPLNELRGSGSYEGCARLGLKPCPFCKPRPERRAVKAPAAKPKKKPVRKQYSKPFVNHIYTVAANGGTEGSNAGMRTFRLTRALTDSELQALSRHSIAAKERSSIDYQSLSEREKRDALTITNPGFAFWAGRGYRCFHLHGCPKLSGVTELRGFATYYDAVHSGLRPCKHCKPSSKFDILRSVPIAQQLRGAEGPETLDVLCEEQGYAHSVDGGKYLIETPVGKWRLVLGTLPVDVYHMHMDDGAKRRNFHKQPRLFLSLTDTFEYIRRHDSALMQKLGIGGEDCGSAPSE